MQLNKEGKLHAAYSLIVKPSAKKTIIQQMIYIHIYNHFMTLHHKNANIQ